MGVEYNQPAHLLDRYIKGVILTVVDCSVEAHFLGSESGCHYITVKAPLSMLIYL